MFRKLASAVSSLAPSPDRTLPPAHHDPARAQSYVTLASELAAYGVPVSTDDCAACEAPCPTPGSDLTGNGTIAEAGSIWDGKKYEDYVLDKYGDLGELPSGFDCDWESELAGSANGGRGRVVVISTGKSDWERDHVDERDSFSHQLDQYINSLPRPAEDKGGKGKGGKDFNTRPPPSAYIGPPALPPPVDQAGADPSSTRASFHSPSPPSLYSSSLISQSDDPQDQTVLVFPDWKVCLEVENSLAGARGIWEGALAGGLSRAGRTLAKEGGSERRRSWVLPYRAVILLCSHKRRDKRCHIAAPLLRSALHTVLAAHNVAIDETGGSLAHLDGSPLEEVQGTEAEREAEVGRRIATIEGARGGDGGEVGIFNINHLGGHRYAGVMLILFPSGAYISYGRVTPQEIPRVVEETILQGKIVPGLLRNAVGVTRKEESSGCNGFLTW